MKPLLKEISLTNGRPLESFMTSSDDFNNTVQLVIGSEIGKGEELFDFTVRNPSVEELSLISHSFTWIKKELVLEKYDPELIKYAVNTILYSLDEHDWVAVVAELRKYMRWEFD